MEVLAFVLKGVNFRNTGKPLLDSRFRYSQALFSFDRAGPRGLDRDRDLISGIF